MKLGLPVRQEPTPERVELSDPPCSVRLVRNRRARRFTLRMDPKSDGAVLSFPPGVPNSEVHLFLDRHREWLRRALSRRPEIVAVDVGAQVPIDGTPTLIVGRRGRRRPPFLEDNSIVLQGAGAAGPRVAAWMKLRARDRLQPAAEMYARQLGVSVARIAFRDTRSRWGSCSTSGALSFSWRLAMAPVTVQEYVAAHEAAHLVEMNHSPRFWALVQGLIPDWRASRDWLRTHGRALHSYQFTDT